MAFELPINQIITGDCLEGGRDVANRRRWQRDNYQKRKSDPEYIRLRKESARRYFLSHRDKCRDRARSYRASNIEAYRAYRRNYRKTSPAGIFSTIQCGAKKRGVSVCFDVAQFTLWWNEQEQFCHYCKRDLPAIKRTPDSVNGRVSRLTVDRVDNAKPYSLDNIRLACYRCNTIKHDYFTEEEMLQIGEMIRAKELAR